MTSGPSRSSTSLRLPSSCTRGAPIASCSAQPWSSTSTSTWTTPVMIFVPPAPPIASIGEPSRRSTIVGTPLCTERFHGAIEPSCPAPA